MIYFQPHYLLSNEYKNLLDENLNFIALGDISFSPFRITFQKLIPLLYLNLVFTKESQLNFFQRIFQIKTQSLLALIHSLDCLKSG